MNQKVVKPGSPINTHAIIYTGSINCLVQVKGEKNILLNIFFFN
jgi:hypothetical protein